MRILQVIPTYAPAWRFGGPIRAVHDLSRALVSRGNEVSVYTTDLDVDGRLDVPRGAPVRVDGVRVTYFEATGRRLHYAPRMRAALARSIADFDVVHLHSVFLWPTAVAARAAARAGVPYVVSPRGMLVRDLVSRRSRFAKEAWIALVERRTLARAAAVHVTSSAERAELARFAFPIRRIEVVPNGVEIPPCPTAESSPTAPTRDVLFLGRLHEKKRASVLLEALARLPGIRATLAGPDDGEGARLARLAGDLGLRDRVAFPGVVEGAEKSGLLRDHRVLVVPSRQENFANVVLEAMAHGLPVIGAPGVGAMEIATRHGAGIVSEATPEHLRAAIAELLADERARGALGRAAAAAAAGYTWDRIAARFEELYESCVEGCATPAARDTGFP